MKRESRIKASLKHCLKKKKEKRATRERLKWKFCSFLPKVISVPLAVPPATPFPKAFSSS